MYAVLLPPEYLPVELLVRAEQVKMSRGERSNVCIVLVYVTSVACMHNMDIFKSTFTFHAYLNLFFLVP